MPDAMITGVGVELRVRLLGGLDVAGLEPHAVGSRKARTLLARLALARDAPVDVDAAAEAVWGDEQPAQPAGQLAVLVSRLRAVLGADRIERRDAGYVLHADWVDVAALDELTQEAANRLADGRAASARAAAAAALALARGRLLPELGDADWVAPDRAATDRHVARARRLLAEAALAAGAPAEAADAAAVAVDADPYDEEALRLLLRAAGPAGRTPAALATYEEFRRRLDDELGIAPEPATERLYLALLRGETTAPAPRRVAVLAGRVTELAALSSALDDARSTGRPVVVEVIGEAGIGKTAVVEAFRQAVAADGVPIAAGRCDELGRDLPLQPVLDAIASLLAGLDAARRTAVLGGDDDLLRRLLGQVADRPEPAASAGVGEGSLQPLVFRTLLDVLLRVADGRPVLLTFDDVHLADRATLAWISYVTRAATAPLLLVAARRIEEGASTSDARSLEIGPLDEAAVAEVVGADRAAVLYARTGGHPLFLTALADADTDALPDSLRDSIVGRARRAGPATATLQTAAVLGPEVDIDLLAAVLDRPLATLLDDLEEGQRRRLLVESSASFTFAHSLVREALEASTSASRRAWLHREAARALAERPWVDPVQLAYHARLAGDALLTARGLAAASEVASARFDHETALELLDEAEALVATAAVEQRRARVLLQLSRYDEAIAAAARAVAAERSADSLEVLSLVTYYGERAYLRAAQLARAAADAATDVVQRMRCLAFAGRCLHAEGRLREADQVLTAAEAEPVATALPDARLYLGALRAHQGRAEEAVVLLAPPSATADPLAFAPVVSAMMRGLAFTQLGRPLEAMAEFDRCESLAAAQALRRYNGRIENCRGHVLRNLGRLDEAREWHERAVEAGAAVGQAEPQAHGWLDLADDGLERGDHEGAAAALDRAAEFAGVAHSYRWRHLLRAALLRGRLALATGDPSTAADLADDVVSTADAQGIERYLRLGRLVRATAVHAAGRDVDRDAVAADLHALTTCAGLDGWRVTRDCAAAFDVADWRRLADERVASLAAHAGEWAEALRSYAGRRPDATSIRTVHG